MARDDEERGLLAGASSINGDGGEWPAARDMDASVAVETHVEIVPGYKKKAAPCARCTKPLDPEIAKLPRCHPRRMLRWGLLPLICLLTFGSYFSYDNPAALEDLLESPPPIGMGINAFQFNLLYSLYSWPNTVLSFIGGIIIDKWLGIRLGAFVFGTLIMVGQLIVSLGSQFGSFNAMLAGRFVFGLGGENLAVAQNAFVVKYFSGKELNMVFGLGLSISRIGSTVNLNIEAPIAHRYNLAAAFWVGLGLCLFSVLDAALLGLIDRRAERAEPSLKPPKQDKVACGYICKFPLTLWFVFLICVFYYVAVFPFIGIATVFFRTKWPEYSGVSTTIDSLPYLISGVASPVFGIVVDRTGFNPVWVTIGSALTMLSHMLMAFTTLTPFVPMVMVGLAYSLLACALWPMVGYLTRSAEIGTAYGLMQAVQNLGLAVVPLAVGQLLLIDPSYTAAMLFFIACTAVSTLLTIFLMFIDIRKGRDKRRLMLTRKGYQALRERMAAEEAERVAASSKGDEADEQSETLAILQPQRRSMVQLRSFYLSRLGIHASQAIGLPQR